MVLPRQHAVLLAFTDTASCLPMADTTPSCAQRKGMLQHLVAWTGHQSHQATYSVLKADLFTSKIANLGQPACFLSASLPCISCPLPPKSSAAPISSSTVAHVPWSSEQVTGQQAMVSVSQQYWVCGISQVYSI